MPAIFIAMNKFKKITLCFGIVSIISGPIIFGFAQKTNAEATSCVGGILIGYLKGLKDIIGVPVNSKAATNVSGQTTGQTVQRCIIEPLVITLARAILSNFTAQTVNWINHGFQGSPLYVTNLEGFLADTADQAIGNYIEGLGPIGKIICSPFDLQLRLSLGIQYSAGANGFYQEIGCRLTDIQQNVQQAFTSGVFGRDGWDNWLRLTAEPQNNIYGAYIRAVDNLGGLVSNRVNTAVKKLDFGSGFLSSEKCVQWSDGAVSGGNPQSYDEAVAQNEPVCLKSVIETPGSLIEDQLSHTLGQQVTNIGLAKDIDAILNALVGQLINQVLGPGGLLGATNSGQSGSGSAVQRSINKTVDQIIAENKKAQALEQGFLATGQTETSFCADFKRNVYAGDKGNASAVSDNSLVFVKIGGLGNYIPAKKPNGAQWTVADYNSVSTFCQNVNITNPLNTANQSFNDQINNAVDSLGIGNETFSQNLSLNQPASQSSNQFAAVTADKAVDGVQTNSDYIMPAITGFEENPWWQVTLEKNSLVESVKIYKVVTTYAAALGTFRIILYDKNRNALWTSERIQTTEQSTIPLVVPVGKIGQIVRIQRLDGAQYLQLAEVEVYGKSAGGSASDVGASAETAEPFAVTFENAVANTVSMRCTISQIACPSGAADINVSFSANKPKTNLKVSVRLEKKVGENYYPENVATIFPSFTAVIKERTGTAEPAGPFDIRFLPASGADRKVLFYENLSFSVGKFPTITYSITPSRVGCYQPNYNVITVIEDNDGGVWVQKTPIAISCN